MIIREFKKFKLAFSFIIFSLCPFSKLDNSQMSHNRPIIISIGCIFYRLKTPQSATVNRITLANGQSDKQTQLIEIFNSFSFNCAINQNDGDAPPGAVSHTAGEAFYTTQQYGLNHSTFYIYLDLQAFDDEI